MSFTGILSGHFSFFSPFSPATFRMDSKLGLLIQLIGVLLITILTLFLQRSLRSVTLKYWTYAWLCLSFALICLRSAFDFSNPASLYSLYFFGEYLFGFMLLTGCRNLFVKEGGTRTSELLIIPLGLIAIGFPLYSKDFDEMYNVHSIILCGFFVWSLIALRHSGVRTFGWRVMHVALGALSIEFFLYSVIFTSNHFAAMPVEMLQYKSMIDLVLETALGFGMVIVLLETVLADVKNENEALTNAHGRLEELVNTDPLTAAFNRHAFYGFIRKGNEEAEAVSGCVGFFDIDNLKEINDQFGHPAGDQAIRTVARSIRDLIRAEDLIYRWGGDEFFVIMVGLDAETAAVRMQRLDAVLHTTYIEEIDEAISIGVSTGFCDFHGASVLEDAIRSADAEMYKNKLQRRQSRLMAGRRVTLIAEAAGHINL